MENYKILNNAFRKNGIQKNLDVDKLVKCRLLDNTEMCQWIKKYYELHYSGQDYDPVSRRNGVELYYILGGNKVAAMQKAGTKAPVTTAARPTTASQKQPRPSAGNTGPRIGGGAKASG